MVEAREKHEAIDSLFARIQPTVYERSAARRCSAERSGLVEKKKTVKERSTTIICMAAVVQASQTTHAPPSQAWPAYSNRQATPDYHAPSVFTSNTLFNCMSCVFNRM